VCGTWTGKQEAKLTDTAERYGKAKWIWSEKDRDRNAPAGTIYLRKTFKLKKKVASASAIVAVDNNYTLFINGHKASSATDNWTAPAIVDVAKQLVVGENVIAVVASNGANFPNPAGFWLHMEIVPVGAKENDKPIEVNTGPGWKWTALPPQGEWKFLTTFNETTWNNVALTGNVDAAPWKLAAYLPDESAIHSTEVRAALCAADPLMVALGRPNREQVSSDRPTATTTLMALELTNGGTLDNVLAAGAKKMSQEKDIRAEDLIGRLYAKGFGRTPTQDEIGIAKELLGVNVSEDGVKDLLWAIVMLPEFQLIR
jgi:hypothetical protein